MPDLPPDGVLVVARGPFGMVIAYRRDGRWWQPRDGEGLPLDDVEAWEPIG